MEPSEYPWQVTGLALISRVKSSAAVVGTRIEDEHPIESIPSIALFKTEKNSTEIGNLIEGRR